jgi:hypothetical protein
MSIVGLRALLIDLIQLLNVTPTPAAVTVVATAGFTSCALALWGIFKLFKKVISQGLLDAFGRIQHIRGRNRAQEKIVDALAQCGTADELLQGLEMIGRVSPLDAPDASVYVGRPPTAVIPTPRAPGGPRVVIVAGDQPTP